ncbi:MAG: beta-galactosidase [Elusimicrobiota bacterium]
MSTLKGGQFMIDGKPFFMLSGEIHYYRIPPKMWDTHLKRAKEAGLNTVSSYIPWGWHEHAEGRFDFDGNTHPQRNIIEYLKKVRKHGLKFIARVGPIANAEMRGEGMPEWLLRNYPDVYITLKDGKKATWPMMNYMDKTFLQKTRKWYDRILPIIKENEDPQGCVVLVQLCNEIGMIHWLAKGADFSEATQEMYRDFLEKKYGTVNKLNKAYGTGYGAFGDIRQPKDGDFSQNKNMLWDWMGFYQHWFAVYYSELFKSYESKGLKSPVLANIPQFYDFDVRGRGVFSPMTSMMFKDFPKFVPHVIFGGAYQMRRLDYENFHDVAITSEVVKLITNPGIPSVCAEMQTGILKDNPRLYPADIELNLKTSAAHGLNGVNCYMFSGGRNEKEFAGMGMRHEWQAPVASNGEKRDHFAPIEEFGRIIRSFGPQLSSTEKSFDTAVGFYTPYYETEYLSGPEIERLENRKMKLFFDGIGRLLQLANINYKFVDIKKATPEELRKYPSIFVFSLEFMDENTQKNLAGYVSQGGKLILNPCMPDKDLNMDKCTALSDALGVADTGRAEKGFYIIGSEDYNAEGELHTFSHNASAKAAAHDLDNRPCAVLTQYGKGSALVMGMGIYHLFDYHIDVIRDFSAMMGITPSVKLQKDLQATVRRNKDYGFLFLTNYNDVPRETKISMVLPGETKATTFPAGGKLKIMNRRGYVIPLNVPLPSGDRIRYAAAEIFDVKESKGKKEIAVRGAGGSLVEIELITSSKNAFLGGKKLAVKRKKGSMLIQFTAEGSIQKLSIR